MASTAALAGHGAAASPRGVCLHFAMLLTVQGSYAWAYTQSPYLRSAVVVPLVFRLAVWTLPVVVWLLVRRVNPLTDLKLHPHSLRGLAWGVAVGAAWMAANLVGQRVVAGSWRLNLDIGLSHWVGGVLFVGLSEEVVFRGFYLPALAARLGFARANLAQALMFLAIHVPGWTLLGQLQRPGVAQLFASILFFGLLAGWLLRRMGSLWTCMLFHSFNNLASFALR